MEISYLFLAEGFEEVEALTVVDMMRRAGMEIRTVSITDEKVVSGAHGIPVSADMLLKEVDFGTAEWLILPGGMPGSKNLGGVCTSGRCSESPCGCGETAGGYLCCAFCPRGQRHARESCGNMLSGFRGYVAWCCGERTYG